MADSCHSCDDQVTVLFQKDIGRKGYVICKPGKYCLGENINWCAHKKSIAITAHHINNVYIDLNNYTIKQKNNAKKTVGIKITHSKGVTIVNGTVENTTGEGAIRIECSSDVLVDQVIVRNTGNANSFGGLFITESKNIIVNNVICDANFGVGLTLLGVNNANVTNSLFNNQKGGNVAPQFFFLPGQTAYGALVESLSNTTTITSMTTMQTVNTMGSMKSMTTNVKFENCSFNNNSATADAGGVEVGPYTLFPVSNVSFINCQALNNSQTGADSIFNDCSGFVLVHVNGFLFQDCIATGQKHLGAPGASSAFAVSGATGFSINDAQNGSLINCLANNNTGIGNTSIGIRVRGAKNVVIKNCQASDNINTSETGLGYGFYTNLDDLPFFPGFPNVNKAYVFDSCVAQNNSSGGFKFSSLIDSLIQKCVAQENGIGFLFSDVGIISPPLVADSKNNILKSNVAEGNTIAGFEDDTTANNAYIKNLSRSNGPLGTTNYVGLPASTPISVWNVATGPFPVGTNEFTNLDIIP